MIKRRIVGLAKTYWPDGTSALSVTLNDGSVLENVVSIAMDPPIDTPEPGPKRRRYTMTLEIAEPGPDGFAVMDHSPDPGEMVATT